MLLPDNGKINPKRIEVLEDAIFNEIGFPDELQKYLYRKEFGLSALEMEEEPLDQFLTNITIYALIKKKEEQIANNG